MTNYKVNKGSKVEIIPLWNKDIRSEVIKRYLFGEKCFCFSCGNAVKSLIEHQVDVIGISGDKSLSLLKANREISVFEAKSIFDCFDATSGHLPLTLMFEISKEIKNVLPKEMFNNKKMILVPTGSGETLLCLSFLFNINRLVCVTADYTPIKFDITPLKDFISKNYKMMYVGKKIKSIKDIAKISPYKNCYFIDTEPWSKI